MLQGFILGITSGTACLAYCAPLLVPVLLGEGKNIQRNYVILGQFLGGRLSGYLLFALLAWAVGFPLSGLQDREVVFGVVYMVLATAITLCFTRLRILFNGLSEEDSQNRQSSLRPFLSCWWSSCRY